MSEELKQQVRHTRERKQFAKAYKVDVTGLSGNLLDRITHNANFVLSNLEIKHEYSIDKKYRELEEYVGLSYDEIKNHHANGFRLFLKQQYRLFKKEDPSEINKLNNDEYIEGLAVGYTFDYIRALTLGKRMEVPASTALKLAEYAYWNNPNILLSLAKQFPNANPGLLVHAAKFNPMRPEEFVASVIEKARELGEKYPNADDSLINRATQNYLKNPEAFLEDSLQKIDDLIAAYPDISVANIKHAVIHNPNNTKAFIDAGIRKLPELKEKYPDEYQGLVKHAVFKSSDPERFIDNVIANISRLKKKYPDVDITIIKTAAIDHANPDAFIARATKKISNLQEKYPNVKVGIIKTAVLGYPSDSETFIEKAVKKIKELEKVYPDVGHDVLTRAATGYAVDPEAYVDNYIQRLSRLQVKHSATIRPYILKKAAHYKDYESALERILNNPNSDFSDSDGMEDLIA